jgi:hypothetical protein
MALRSSRSTASAGTAVGFVLQHRFELEERLVDAAELLDAKIAVAIRSRLLRVRTLAIDSASVACRARALTVTDASRGAPVARRAVR